VAELDVMAPPEIAARLLAHEDELRPHMLEAIGLAQRLRIDLAALEAAAAAVSSDEWSLLDGGLRENVDEVTGVSAINDVLMGARRDVDRHVPRRHAP
jgi:hypothetical protein